MMTNIPIKNGLPWTSVFKLPAPAPDDVFNQLQNLWENTDWGKNFENYRRDRRQLAIYPSTRNVTYNPLFTYEDKTLGNLTEQAAEEIKKHFPIQMKVLWSELTLLTPFGVVPWHHDRMKTGTYATRVMIPLTDNENIKYYFTSWSEDTMENNLSFSVDKFLADDMCEVEMSQGQMYTFNHRVPHKTVSMSPKPRGMLMVEMIPVHLFDPNWTNEFGPITMFEKTKILPATL